MTLAEKLVTAIVNELRKNDWFGDYWHAIGRDRDRYMFDMRYVVQYILDEELVKRLSHETVTVVDNAPRVTDILESVRLAEQAAVDMDNIRHR
jgi:hypothetical protein